MPQIPRPRAILLALLTATAVIASGCAGAGSGNDDDGPILVGSVLDETGNLNIYGEHAANATKLAIDDINANGGVLGRPLELVSYDAQSGIENYTRFVDQLALQDQVEVVMAGITSASREAIRPVAGRHQVPYFFNVQYEGGMCDRNAFGTGAVASQQLAALIPWAMKNVGKNVYILAADYVYGQASAVFARQYVEAEGGTVLGEEFIPLEVNDFGPTITKLQQAKPDVIVSLLVGSDHIAFYRQFAAAGLNKDMRIVSPVWALGNEQVILDYDVSQGITVAYPYFQELENPTNEKFVATWHKAYGEDYPYIPDIAADTWNGWHIWALAVEKAGTLDRDAVLDALESGITFDGPGGAVTLDGATHHMVKDIHIAVTNDKHGFEILESQSQVPPAYEQEVCDLLAEPTTNKQFIPER